MKNRDLAKVLKAGGLPESGKNVLVGTCLFVLPIGSVASGICFNRSSNPFDVRLVVFHQPLFVPRTYVWFGWPINVSNRRNSEFWDFDGDPTSKTSVTMVEAVKSQCLPLAETRITLEEVHKRFEAESCEYTDDFLLLETRVLALAMLNRYDEAWRLLKPMMEGSRELRKNPKKFGEPGFHVNQFWAEEGYLRLIPLEEAFKSADRESAVDRQMNQYVLGTKKAIGLEGFE